jgi:hypothetical protein
LVDRVVSTLSLCWAKPGDVYSAPALVTPQIFDLRFCRHLIDLYEATGGREIGLIESDGKIIERSDREFRRRLDYCVSE